MKEGNKTDNTTTASTAVEKSNPIFQYDEYWLARGKEFADNTLPALSARMQSYLNFLNYIAGGAIVGGVALVAYLKSSDPWLFGFFIIPTMFNIFARYYISFKINEGIPTYPDLRSPIQINEAFNKIVSVRKQQIRRAGEALSIVVILTLLLIPVGMFYSNTQRDQKADVEISFDKKTFEISGNIHKDTLFISVFGKTIPQKVAPKTSNENDVESKEKTVTKTLLTKEVDTIISLQRRVEKGTFFSYVYERSDFGIKVERVGVRYSDGDVLRGVEKKAKY